MRNTQSGLKGSEFHFVDKLDQNHKIRSNGNEILIRSRGWPSTFFVFRQYQLQAHVTFDWGLFCLDSVDYKKNDR